MIIRTPIRLTFAAVLATALGCGVVSNMQAVGSGPGRPDPTDFNIFHLVGDLAVSGRLDQAYAEATMRGLERALTGSDSYMPWSYPPAFGFVLAPLALLPIWLAQTLFAGLSLALFLLATRRLARDQAWPVWLALVPCLVLNLEAGQNGLLTGGLAALVAISLKRGPWRPGAAAAALTVKPHLAVMMPVLFVLERRWLALLVAGAATVGLTAASIAAFGWPAFVAFLRSYGDVQRHMAAGSYPLRRMISVYAALLSCGLRPGAALAIHLAVAVGVMMVVCRAALAARDERVRLGLPIAATIFISPYLYDYDAAMFGVGLALVAPALAERLPTRRFGLLLAGVAGTLAVGLVSLRLGIRWSVSAPLLLALFGIMVRTLAFDPVGATAGVRMVEAEASAS